MYGVFSPGGRECLSTLRVDPANEGESPHLGSMVEGCTARRVPADRAYSVRRTGRCSQGRGRGPESCSGRRGTIPSVPGGSSRQTGLETAMDRRAVLREVQAVLRRNPRQAHDPREGRGAGHQQGDGHEPAQGGEPRRIVGGRRDGYAPRSRFGAGSPVFGAKVAENGSEFTKTGPPLCFRVESVYGSHDPDSIADRKLHRWATRVVDTFPGVNVFIVPRQRKRSVPVRPDCSADMRGTEEEGVDVRMTTDMISLA